MAKLDDILHMAAADADAHVDYAAMKQAIEIRQKTSERKRRTLMRDLSAAAVFLVIVGAGATYLLTDGFYANAAKDSAPRAASFASENASGDESYASGAIEPEFAMEEAEWDSQSEGLAGADEFAVEEAPTVSTAEDRHTEPEATAAGEESTDEIPEASEPAEHPEAGPDNATPPLLGCSDEGSVGYDAFIALTIINGSANDILAAVNDKLSGSGYTASIADGVTIDGLAPGFAVVGTDETIYAASGDVLLRIDCADEDALISLLG